MAEEAKELGLFLSIEMSLGCGVQQQMPGGHNYLDNWQGQRGSPGALTSQELLVEFHLSINTKNLAFSWKIIFANPLNKL